MFWKQQRTEHHCEGRCMGENRGGHAAFIARTRDVARNSSRQIWERTCVGHDHSRLAEIVVIQSHAAPRVDAFSAMAHALDHLHSAWAVAGHHK
eukprot:1453008-Pyramimonas_sp.AAC.1